VKEVSECLHYIYPAFTIIPDILLYAYVLDLSLSHRDDGRVEYQSGPRSWWDGSSEKGQSRS
jgi:hypothetical protein